MLGDSIATMGSPLSNQKITVYYSTLYDIIYDTMR